MRASRLPGLLVLATTDLVTLCAGAAFGPDSTYYHCSGTFTDTDFDITCTGQTEITPTCSSSFSEHLLGSRNGDVVSPPFARISRTAAR